MKEIQKNIAIFLSALMLLCSLPINTNALQNAINQYNAASYGATADEATRDEATLDEFLPPVASTIDEVPTVGPTGSKVDPEKYRGTTIKLAVTIDPKNDESGPVIEEFKKEYGIDVKIVLVSNSDYANGISGLIAAAYAPDVVWSNANIPSCFAYLQPIENAKLDYSDPIWNQKMFEFSTFGGQPYLCSTVNNPFAETDIVVYSKSLLKKAGIPTPETYDQAGKWTWDTYFEICRKLKNSGVEYGGGFITRESAIYGMGGGLINLQNGKFVNSVNTRTQEAMVKYTEAWKDGIINWYTTDGIEAGTVGITTSHIWKLKKTSDWGSGFNVSDLGFYYLPRWDAGSDYGNTGIVRGWGILERKHRHFYTMVY